MYLTGAHRPILQRLRLTASRRLGAGNFFWQCYRVAKDLDRPIIHWLDGADVAGVSLRQMRERVLRYANWYRSTETKPGARVGVYTQSGLHGLLHHIAITSLGATTVLTNPRMTTSVAAEYFRVTGTTRLVADTDLLEGVFTAARDTTWTRQARGASAAVEVVDREADDASLHTGYPYRHRDSDLVLVSHSSGTTGTPKPTSFTHRSFFIGKRERLWRFPSARTDRLLTALPQSHSAGISYLSLAILLGLPTLMMEDASGVGVASGMNAFQPTVVIGFPSSLADLPVDDLAPPATAAVHTWMGMGDASHERHIRSLVQVGRRRVRGGWSAGSAYFDGLGSSEMGMVLFRTVHTPETENYDRLIGQPVRVVRRAATLDENGNEVPAGTAGRLGVQTPSATPGYLNQPELTECARSGDYFLTGDVVRKDHDGRWYHLDRTPDVIETAAGPVYSLPVEEVVLNETLALDAAVVAVVDPGAEGKFLPAAVVLFKGGGGEDPQRLLARCNAELTRKRLTRLAALIVAPDRDALPVGITGKVLKRVLRDRHHSVLTGQAPPGVAIDLSRRTGPAGKADGVRS